MRDTRLSPPRTACAGGGGYVPYTPVFWEGRRLGVEGGTGMGCDDNINTAEEAMRITETVLFAFGACVHLRLTYKEGGCACVHPATGVELAMAGTAVQPSPGCQRRQLQGCCR